MIRNFEDLDYSTWPHYKCLKDKKLRGIYSDAVASIIEDWHDNDFDPNYKVSNHDLQELVKSLFEDDEYTEQEYNSVYHALRNLNHDFRNCKPMKFF